MKNVLAIAATLASSTISFSVGADELFDQWSAWQDEGCPPYHDCHVSFHKEYFQEWIIPYQQALVKKAEADEKLAEAQLKEQVKTERAQDEAQSSAQQESASSAGPVVAGLVVLAVGASLLMADEADTTIGLIDLQLYGDTDRDYLGVFYTLRF